MPELPEVETIKNAMKKALEGATVLKADVNNPHLRKLVPASFSKDLTGGRFVSFKRIAKYITGTLDNGYTFILHLGMSGTIRLLTERGEILKHDHIVLKTDKGYMIYNDPRRFGLCLTVKTENLQNFHLFQKTGIDPFDEHLTGAFLKEKLIKKTIPIKLALLDQSLICGIGNIYASEALFLSGILPDRPANSLTLKECRMLVEKVRQTLTQAIAAGGSSLKDYRKPDGSLGYFQNQHCVYGKEGLPCPDCRCDTAKTGGIHRSVLGGRSTYFCVTKQR